MEKMQKKSFVRYIEDCKALQRELQHAINDLHFTSDQNHTIRYAVDFSEIYAYVLPDETVQEFHLFVDESESKTDLIQRLALQRLFDELPEKLILLAPYAIELQGFLVKLRQSGL